jgi:predicted CXXCH cytochrome family protein
MQDTRIHPTFALAAVIVAAAGLLLTLPAGAGAAAEHPELDEELAGACTECHSDLFEGAAIHPPADGDCESCHEMTAGDDEWSVALAAPAEEICLMCHDNPAEIEEAGSIHYPALEGECLACHDPHSSNRTALLRGKGNEICFECHSEQQEALEKPSVHDVVTILGCPSCHNPHAAAGPRLLRKAGNRLCMECHTADPDAPQVDDAGRIVLFARQKVEADYFDSIPKLSFPGKAQVGHPVSRHPVEGDNDPRRPGEPFGCTSCHDPHGSDRDRLLIGGKGFGLCRQCHSK